VVDIKLVSASLTLHVQLFKRFVNIRLDHLPGSSNIILQAAFIFPEFNLKTTLETFLRVGNSDFGNLRVSVLELREKFRLVKL
jgi:hypothetical protein